MPITASFLLQLEWLPRTTPPTERQHSCYWSAVEGGLPRVPELLDLVTDATITRHHVPLFGGSYAVGDIALTLLMKIVSVPVLDMVLDLDPDANTTCGFCAYWNFVHADPANRKLLQAEIEAWYSANREKLKWRDLASSPVGGLYEVLP